MGTAATDGGLTVRACVCPEAIRIPTVSFTETEINTTALTQFDRLLRKGDIWGFNVTDRDKPPLKAPQRSIMAPRCHVTAPNSPR